MLEQMPSKSLHFKIFSYIATKCLKQEVGIFVISITFTFLKLTNMPKGFTEIAEWRKKQYVDFDHNCLVSQKQFSVAKNVFRSIRLNVTKH